MNGIVYRDFERVSEEIIDQLAALGVSTLHESMTGDRLVDARIRPIAQGQRIAGQAVTVHNAPGENLGVHVGLEVARAGDVLVVIPGVPTGSASAAALWGGVVTECAKARGVRGVVADGQVRDVSVIRDLSFPVWARGVSARGGRKQSFVGVNVPVACGGVVVWPGDVVVADDDGVLVLAPGEIPAVLERAAERRRRESELIALLRSGATTTYQYLNVGDLERSDSVTLIDGSYGTR